MVHEPFERRHCIFFEQTRIVSGVPNMTSLRDTRQKFRTRQIRSKSSPLLFKLDAIQISKMPHCVVPLCTNYSRKPRGMGISYHRLPRGPLKGVWLRNARRENPRKPANCYVCSSHFEPDCFEPSREICGYKKPN